MQYTIKGKLTDNTVTTDNLEDMILQISAAGSVSLSDVIDEMKNEDTGLRRETIEHVVDLYHRVVERLVLSGYNVNTGLFYAVAQARGVIENGTWNPEKNSLYVSVTQGKQLREAIAQTKVVIDGMASEKMYLTGNEDTSTRATDGTVTPGRNFILNGRNIKIAGDDPTVGLKLTDSKGVETPIPMDMIAVNNPSQLIFLIPSGLSDGVYTLSVTTQFSGSSTALLKTPRTVSRQLTVGNSGGGGEGEGEDPAA
ncbi:DNA-binding domain-containing protein [Bacteroides sp.]